MKKLTILFAALTLCVGMWAQESTSKSEAITAINQAADNAIAEVQNASSVEYVKQIQEKAKHEIDITREYYTAQVQQIDERFIEIITNEAIDQITRIKNDALREIQDAIDSQDEAKQIVSYFYPVYNLDGDAASGIKEWRYSEVEATKVTSAESRVTWNTGWYVVTGEVTFKEGVECKGAVHLILANGAKLKADGAADVYTWKTAAAVQVSEPNYSLSIYAQSTDSTQMGQLLATPMSHVAGIGGGYYSSGYNVTINGGKITATGGEEGAGIGGGSFGLGTNITINGGIITARGGRQGAGIGGGDAGVGSNIIINGGDVRAFGGQKGAGIGSGQVRGAENIIINGGKITAVGGAEDTGYPEADAIGNGSKNKTPSSNIRVAANLVLKADGNNPPTTEIATSRTSETDIASELASKHYVTIDTKPIATTYIDENDVMQEVDAWDISFSTAPVTWGEAGKTTWYVVTGNNVLLSHGAVCRGDVRLILADGAKLTTTGWGIPNHTPGIQVSGEGNSLAIYGQTAQSGQLIAEGGDLAAGIGGERMGIGSNITINGGIVTAKGGMSAAGIGGGFVVGCSNITINNGVVTATGGYDGAGIGGGYYGTGSNITIKGGKITANGGTVCAGIGNGFEARKAASNIFVATDLVVKAGYNDPPTTVIENDGGDLASSLVKKPYVTIESEAASDLIDVNDNSKFLIQNSKFIKDGQLFIRKNGKTYTIMGVEE